MAKALANPAATAKPQHLSHAEWLGLLLEREWSSRYDHKLAARLSFAKLRHQATPEDVDYRSERGLDRALFMKLLGSDWISPHHNLASAAPRVSERDGWPVRLAPRLAETIVPFSISVFRDYSPSPHLRVVTADLRSFERAVQPSGKTARQREARAAERQLAKARGHQPRSRNGAAIAVPAAVNPKMPATTSAAPRE